MYQHYYLNENEDYKKNHEVHTGDCTYLPDVTNRYYLGYFSSCKDAIEDAKAKKPSWNIDGCFFCSRECHHI